MNTIWRGWRPTTKKYNPNDPHFDPMHPPEDTPKEVLEDFWGESADPNEIIEPPKRDERGMIILPWKKSGGSESSSN